MNSNSNLNSISSPYSLINDSNNSNFKALKVAHLTNINNIDNKIDKLTINSPASKDNLFQNNTKNDNLSNLTCGPLKSSDRTSLEKQSESNKSQPYFDRKSSNNSNINKTTNLSGEFTRTEAIPHLFRNFRATKFCKRCGVGNSIVVYDSKSGSEICTRCGVVVEDRVINEEQEWRSFSNDGNDGNSKSRIGSINDAWLDDGTDSQLVVGDKKLMKTMMKHNTQASSDRLIKEVFGQLRQVASNFCLHDNIIERCKEIVKEQSNLNILKSGKKNVLAIVYVACREEGVSRTVKELLTYDRTISERELVRAINKLKKDLPRKGPNLSSSAAELMPRFCHYLQLSHEIVGIAEHVCRHAEQYINKSHRPNSLAAGAIYFVCNLCDIQIDMRSVAVAAKSGETTVRGVYRELLLVGDKLLPKDFVPKLNGGIETLKRKSKIFEA